MTLKEVVYGNILRPCGTIEDVFVEIPENKEQIGKIAYHTYINELLENGESGFSEWESLPAYARKAWVKVGKLSVTVKEI